MEDCPYCLSPIADNEEATECPVCGAAYHAECYEESGGCAYKDCEKRARPNAIEVTVDAEPHTVLVLSKESVEQAPSVARKRTSNPCLKCGAQLPEGQIYCAECEPTISDSMDTTKLAPLLVMIGLIALVVVWLTIWLLSPDKEAPKNDFTVGPMTREVDR